MTVDGARSLRVGGIIGLAMLLPFIYAAAGWAFLYLFDGAARRLRVPGPAGLPAGLVAAVRGITRPESVEGRNAPTRAAIPFDVMRPWVRSRSALAISVNATLECAALSIDKLQTTLQIGTTNRILRGRKTPLFFDNRA